MEQNKTMDLHSLIRQCRREIESLLVSGIIPFWLKNGNDKEYGGYLTNFDADGKAGGDTDKYIVTQTRMIWGLSALHQAYPQIAGLKESADQGMAFFLKYFWDGDHGGWRWRVRRDGTPIDSGKLVYGQTFAIYALCEYTLATGDPVGLEYSERTFNLLQKYCADTCNGGYYENFGQDWKLAAPGFDGGDRKSLDIHMHMMEALTVLALCSGKEVHRRKLQECMDLILQRMVDMETGCGMNQFDPAFRPIPAISVRRTWNAERATGETISRPTDTTSYGHNVELVWLLNRAADVLGLPRNQYDDVTRKLSDHCLKYGFDGELGGVYRDGPRRGEPLVRDKEWWQNCEVLVGFLDAFEHLGDAKYFDAFRKTWDFDNRFMVNHEIGEFRQLLDRFGNVLVGDIGNPWKAIYHSGRAMLECVRRLDGL